MIVHFCSFKKGVYRTNPDNRSNRPLVSAKVACAVQVFGNFIQYNEGT